MRRNPTISEAILWERLRRNALGVHFRRQVPFGLYILDFVALNCHLVVEVDGARHSVDHDAARDAFLAQSGFRVLRVKAWMVERHISLVLAAIRAAL
jgi:very-short-patch-repair endonuclease